MSSARKTVGKIGKGIDKLAAFAAAQVARARKGDGKMAALKKHHEELISGGAKAAKAAIGNMFAISKALRGVDSALAGADKAADAIDDAVGAAEIVLKGSP